jgi:hypothetical protein
VFGGTGSPQNAIERFTLNEWKMLLTPAEFHPDYAPYEVLITRLTATSPEYCHQHLQEAHQRGTLRQELGPIRDVVKTLRVKLRSISVVVVSLYGLGYSLAMVASPAHSHRKHVSTPGRMKTP